MVQRGARAWLRAWRRRLLLVGTSIGLLAGLAQGGEVRQAALAAACVARSAPEAVGGACEGLPIAGAVLTEGAEAEATGAEAAEGAEAGVPGGDAAEMASAEGAEAGVRGQAGELILEAEGPARVAGTLGALGALGAPGPAAVPALPALRGRFLIVNQHGSLFHSVDSDLHENAAYAAWLGAGAIRVFGTDNNRVQPWGGRQVGQRIVQWAPSLRQHDVRLVVALVNNHRPVPGEPPESQGWMDGYYQLLLPFYARTWQDAYLRFAREVITTVREQGALDVIAAWELGNELHTPQAPSVLTSFVQAAVWELRRVDRDTPIWPGTMGANHVQPWNPWSPVARWLYCEAPLDAYTLHAYDWVSPDRPGDMPIDWDLEHVVREPCPSGRRLPVVVEELGTSRALPGYYTAAEEHLRLEQERRQLRFVLSYPIVRAVGVWNGLSPRVADMTFSDNRRGLTSYGSDGRGGGSCYDPATTVRRSPQTTPTPVPPSGANVAPRCQLEQILRALPAAP